MSTESSKNSNFSLSGQQRYRPFFIIGVGRSGSTLLRRFLSAHSKLYVPPETFVIGDCIERFEKYGQSPMEWRQMVQFIMATFQFHPEFDAFEVELSPLVDELLEIPAEQQNLAYLLDQFYRFHAKRVGVKFQRWGDKSSSNSWYRNNLEGICGVFPDAQFIHLVRDGCDVVASMLKSGFASEAWVAGQHWNRVIRHTRSFVDDHATSCFELRYESLVTDTRSTINRVCEFLEVDFESQMIASEASARAMGDVPAYDWHREVFKPVTTANIGKGRTCFLTTKEKQDLQTIIGRQMSELGYQPCTAGK